MKITHDKRLNGVITPKDPTPRNPLRKRMKSVHSNRKVKTLARASRADKLKQYMKKLMASFKARQVEPEVPKKRKSTKKKKDETI